MKNRFPSRLGFAFALLCFAAASALARESWSLDADWRFQRGDAPDAWNQLTYETIKPWILPTGDEMLEIPVARVPVAGRSQIDGVSYSREKFDDSSWRSLDVPHDWAIEGPFQLDLPGETGKLPWAGVGWYRKHFTVPADAAGKRVYVDFEGAMSHSVVWLNGHFVGGWPYGYASFRLDLSQYARPGSDNVLAVRLENPPESSRWYPGAGLYRNVWLVVEDPVHVEHWGVAVTTPRVSADSATAVVTVMADNETSEKTVVGMSTDIFELEGDGSPGRHRSPAGKPAASRSRRGSHPRPRRAWRSPSRSSGA